MAETINIKLGKRIRALRKNYNLTQEELADRAGISTKYLQNLEGRTPKLASINTVEKIAQAFDIPLSQLLKF